MPSKVLRPLAGLVAVSLWSCSSPAGPQRSPLEAALLPLAAEALGAPSQALAEQGVYSDPLPPALPRDERTSAFLAVGPGAAPQFEGADSYQPIPFTVVRLREDGFAFESEGLGGRVDVTPTGALGPFDVGPAFEVRLARDDTGDVALDALETIDTALEVGGFVRHVAAPGWLESDEIETRLTVNSDVTGTHDGVVAQLESDYAWFPRRNVRLSLGLRSSYASDNFMDTYFGVDAAGAAASGLEAYDPGAGFRSVGAQASCLFLFNPHHGVFFLARYDQLVGEVADSPVVDDVGSDGQWLFGLSYAYRF